MGWFVLVFALYCVVVAFRLKADTVVDRAFRTAELLNYFGFAFLGFAWVTPGFHGLLSIARALVPLACFVSSMLVMSPAKRVNYRRTGAI